MANKPTVSVHKFSSCDGCQLALLNLGEDLLALTELVDLKHFLEAGLDDEHQAVDIAFVEGSISTEADLPRIQQVRKNSRYLVTIGACATAGGLQALRNLADENIWRSAIYASPEYIDSLSTATPIRDHVKVDLELWGCPINSRQLLAAVRALLFGVAPVQDNNKVCQTCKQNGTVCVMVSRGEPCMGPVTRTGCGAICPDFGRGCYACYGPAENINGASLAHWLQGLGLNRQQVARRFLQINSGADPFHSIGKSLTESDDV
jgi:sulfhydrogenase subunit delta